MWWEYLIVAIVVAGSVLYLLRGLLGVVRGKSNMACGGCSCGEEQPGPRLGKKKPIVQLGIDSNRPKTGA